MLEVRDVTVRFGSTVALDGLSFHLGRGEAVVVRGPSGCGKTTLLRVIAGLAAPSSGEVWIEGSPASRPGHVLVPYRRDIAVVFQEPRLWPHMTVRENVTFGLAGWSPADREKRLNLIAETVGIATFLTRCPSELSGGQARRVALARALAAKRRLVLMDEPVTNLDDSGRHDLVDVVKRFWEEEKFGLLYVTHDAAEDVPFTGRTIRLDRGRLLRDAIG